MSSIVNRPILHQGKATQMKTHITRIRAALKSTKRRFTQMKKMRL